MRIIFLLIFLFPAGFLKSQENSKRQERDELGFLNYLINSRQYEDAIFQIGQIPLSQYRSNSYQDSVCFFKGWSFYSLRQLDSSAVWFQKVRAGSTLYLNSLFLASSDYVFLNQRDRARELLDKITLEDSLALQAKNLELAGLCLLNRDFKSYEGYSIKFGHSNYAIQSEEIILDDCYKSITTSKNKSMFLAGLFSAIVPGSGKIYAGKTGEGISALLLIGFLSAITAENCIKAGPVNYKTIGFGCLTTIFYLGNIYGSAVSVKVAHEELFRKYDNTILLHIHVPLRSIYGK